MRAVEGGL